MKTLISTEEEIVSLSTASYGLTPKTLTPYMTNSRASREVRKITGDTLFEAVLNLYGEEGMDLPENEKYKNLLPYVQRAVLELAVYDYIREGHTKITNAGLESNLSQDKRAYRWQVIERKNTAIEKAYFALDALIEYLQLHIDDFSDWGNSNAYANTKAFIINDAETFSEWVSIGGSYRTLKALQPYMKHIETRQIQGLLSPTLYKALKDAISADNLDEDMEALMVYLVPAMANLTMAKAVEHLQLDITANGALVSSLKAVNDDPSEVVVARTEELRRRAEKFKIDGDAFIKDLTDYLNANASESKYVGYYESENYTSPDVEVSAQNENTNIYKAL